MSALVGRHGAMKPAGRVRIRNMPGHREMDAGMRVAKKPRANGRGGEVPYLAAATSPREEDKKWAHNLPLGIAVPERAGLRLGLVADRLVSQVTRWVREPFPLNPDCTNTGPYQGNPARIGPDADLTSHGASFGRMPAS